MYYRASRSSQILPHAIGSNAGIRGVVSSKSLFPRHGLRNSHHGHKAKFFKWFLFMLLTLVVGLFVSRPQNNPLTHNSTQNDQSLLQNLKKNIKNVGSDWNLGTCSFRTYKSNRYYNVVHDSTQESFLVHSEYIRGQYPFVLNPHSNSNLEGTKASKLCLNTSSWEHVEDGYRPFSDGQNPSLVSFSNLATLDHDMEIIHKLYGSNANNNANVNDSKVSNTLEPTFLGLILFGDSQCRWNMTQEELEEFHSSPLQSPPSKRTMMVVLDSNLNPLGEAVLELELDQNWGNKRRKHFTQKNDHGDYNRIIIEMDDARLFFHEHKLYVLYRNGPSFGYDQQLQNVIHTEQDQDGRFKAFIKSSETFIVCCGRNIAFISEPAPSSTQSSTLYALTWIDPVTTEVVNHAHERRRLTVSESMVTVEDNSVETIPTSHLYHRRLKTKEKKSFIHGTNGNMIRLQSSSEYLGVAHFHRPENRDTSHYARHGHHYTHAFFTIKQSQKNDSHEHSFHLSRISNEFVFASPSSLDNDTADVIQFASGLDLIGSDIDGKLLISYGINDCESAVLWINMERIQKLLLPLQDGQKEVVDLIARVTL